MGYSPWDHEEFNTLALLSTHTFVSQVQVVIVLLSLLPSNIASLMENPRWH